MSTYTVKEQGKNGTVEIIGATIVRTIRKVIGKDDVTTIPLRMVASVHLNRRTMGADVVTVTTTGGQTFEWKTSGASDIANSINTYTP